jgi:hypothetical protein
MKLSDEQKASLARIEWPDLSEMTRPVGPRRTPRIVWAVGQLRAFLRGTLIHSRTRHHERRRAQPLAREARQNDPT